MPRKKRQIEQDPRKAGFVEDSDLGKESHAMGVHPRFPDIRATIAGHDGEDAKPYAEQSLRTCLAEVARRLAVFYLVTVPDLPELVTAGRTRAEAAAMGEDAIAAWISSVRKWGSLFPSPGRATCQSICGRKQTWSAPNDRRDLRPEAGAARRPRCAAPQTAEA